MKVGAFGSEKELLEEIERRAHKYAKEYHSCSQCTLLAVQEMFGPPGEDVLKAATGFAGGIGRTGSVCGAVLGGVMALGLLYGRDRETMKHPDASVRAQRREEIELKLGTLIKRLRAKFDEEYGSTICNDIETKLFGRSFDKWNPEDRKEKDRLGGHDDKCPKVVGKATRWVAELILEEQSKSNLLKSSQ
jgi:C_GCAxxG_C_C family probable redox protein